MARVNIGLRLRDKLGSEAANDLSHAFQEVQNEMLTITSERFEARLTAVDPSCGRTWRGWITAFASRWRTGWPGSAPT